MTENYLNILAETIRNNWDQPALTDFYLTEDGSAQDTTRGNHYTYGEMYAEICRVVELLTSLGLQKGDHIAICGANSAHWVIAYLAIAKMQGVSVTVMHSLMPEEIARLVDFSDAKALFVDEEIWRELLHSFQGRAGDRLISVIGLEDWVVLGRKKGGLNKSSLPLREEIEVGFPSVSPDSLAMICFTSGTSGNSKGVMLSYGNIDNNTLNAVQAFPSSENKNIISILPFSHMYGLMIELQGQVIRGRHIYISRENPTIDCIWKGIMLVRPCGMAIIPFFVTNLYQKYRTEIIENWCKFCKQIHIGGAVPNNYIIEDLRDNGIPISVGYGLTETGPLISDSQSPIYRCKSVGKIVSGMTARISPAGEILVKGENVMLGYYKDPEATARKIDSDGWLHTGDKGHLDEDGYLYVEGRLEQDIIVLPNGENIRPDNIESLINALPEVSESIVFARDGKLVAIAVVDSQMSNVQSQITNTDLRRMIMRKVNPSLPLFSQLYDVEITDQPLARTEKQTIKRYLYK